MSYAGVQERSKYQICKSIGYWSSYKINGYASFSSMFRVAQYVIVDATNKWIAYDLSKKFQISTVCWQKAYLQIRPCGTPLIPMSARRAMTEQGVCQALSERPLSHRAKSLDSHSPSARQTPCSPIVRWALVGISGVCIPMVKIPKMGLSAGDRPKK